MNDQFREDQFFETPEQPQVQEQDPGVGTDPNYFPPQSPFYREDVIMQMQIREQVEREQERLHKKAVRRQQRRLERQTHGWKLGVAVLSLITLCVSTFGGVYWASTLLNRTHDTNQTGTFFFPSDEKAIKEVADITTLQNSEYASIADISDDVGHSVVTIVTTVAAQDPSGIPGDSVYGEALGSGVIIGESDDELYIATNFHVINNASDVKILMGSDETVSATAYYKGSDSGSDLAVIYVKKSDLDEDTLKEIKIATLGDSDSLKVGDLAIAIGSPVNKTYSNTVTAGIISGLERSVSFRDEDTGLVNTLILLQTDAAINPGNSGGALVNGRGEIIGINDAKIVSSDVEGMGFAIPISTAKPVLEELINHGKVIQPYLGIMGSGIDAASEFAVTYGMFSGVYVQSVLDGLSADKAGIQVDDVIIEFNGQKIDTFKDLTDALHACEIGQTVEVKVVRGYVDGDPETVTLSLTIQEKPGDFD